MLWGRRPSFYARGMSVTTQADKAIRFLQLHRPGSPLLMPNPWDPGSAKVLAAAGFEALATTSSGSAGTLGRQDGALGRDDAIALAAAIAAVTDVPVSADLEHCFAADVAGVAETAALAVDAGLAGFSIEDYDRTRAEPIIPLDEAVERVAAAVDVAHGGDVHVVVTARAENHIRGRDDLDDTLTRLQAYAAAGADAVFAPGVARREDIARIVQEVGRPVNVIAGPGSPPVAQLAEIGVARVSVGGSFWYAAMGALVGAATDLREGRDGYWSLLRDGRAAVKAAAFSDPA